MRISYMGFHSREERIVRLMSNRLRADDGAPTRQDGTRCKSTVRLRCSCTQSACW